MSLTRDRSYNITSTETSYIRRLVAGWPSCTNPGTIPSKHHTHSWPPMIILSVTSYTASYLCICLLWLSASI